jgi:type IV secretion system protein VirD4
LRFRPAERNLNSVCELVADPALFAAAVGQLKEMGGIPGRLGGYLSGLRDKELSSVISTANRQLACFTSELVAAMLARSSFDPAAILRCRPGTTVYFVLPQDQLQAQRGTLRLVVSSFLRLVLQRGAEQAGEVLFLLDECAALGQLDELEQALVLGRGAGVRLMTFWQSADQARVAFKDKPGLLFDNSATQIYFAAASYETAERVSKMLGDQTIVLEGYSESVAHSASHSSSQGGGGSSHGTQVTAGRNYSEIGRALLRPEEVLAMSREYLIAFLPDVPPVLARRVKWYQEQFTRLTRRAPGRRPGRLLWWLLLAAALALLAWGLSARP